MNGMTPTQEVDLALANANMYWDEADDEAKREFPSEFFDKARSLAIRLEQSEKGRLRALSAVAEALSHFPDDHALLEAHRTLASNKLDEQQKESPIDGGGYLP
jgi:hypothetical protein